MGPAWGGGWGQAICEWVGLGSRFYPPPAWANSVVGQTYVYEMSDDLRVEIGGRSIRDIIVQSPVAKWRARRRLVRAITTSDVTGAISGMLRFSADQIEGGERAAGSPPPPPTPFTLTFTPSRLGGVGGGRMMVALVVADDEGETDVLALRRVQA